MTAAFPVIAGYRILRLLGEGGMGQVFLAEDEALGRRVAVKTIGARQAASPEATARLLREARALATIEHPRVVRVYGYGEAAGQPYFVMEHVEGETLARRLQRLVRLPVDEALRLVRETVEALSAAWRRGIVHRDVKPSNLLLDADDHVRVADFGLARALSTPADSSLTGGGLLVGTPFYISPEQARQGEVDFRSDIYSLGVVLFEMLAGRRPFTGNTPLEVLNRQLSEPLPPLGDTVLGVPGHVETLLRWMTEKDREKRPSSYATLLHRLGPETVGGRLESEAPTSTFSRLAGPPSRRRRPITRWFLGVAAAGVVGAAILWPLSGGRGPIPSGGMAIAVLPFSGPDAESAREGRVIATLLEHELARRLDQDAVPVVGPAVTKEPATSAAAAREWGREARAGVVVFGQVVTFRGETEIQVALLPVAKGRLQVALPPARIGILPGRPLEALRGAVLGLTEPILRMAACEAQALGSKGDRAQRALASATGDRSPTCGPDDPPSR